MLITSSINWYKIISFSAETANVNTHGHNVLRLCQLFVKLCSILKISLEVPEDEHTQLPHSLKRHSNIFTPCSSSSRYAVDEDVRMWTGNNRTVSIDNLVFFWGFESGTSARNLKHLLTDSHDVSSDELDVRMLDRTCAVVVFWTPGLSERFLRTVADCEGLRAAGYETYKRVCKLAAWKPSLAVCLELALDETETLSRSKPEMEQSVIFWNDDEIINLDDLWMFVNFWYLWEGGLVAHIWPILLWCGGVENTRILKSRLRP